MKVTKHIVKNDFKEFDTFKFKFSYQSDKKIIDQMIEKTIDLEKKLNSVLARDSSRNRSLIIKKTNIFAGLVSEYIWATFIREYAKKNNIIIEISYGDFSPIDLD